MLASNKCLDVQDSSSEVGLQPELLARAWFIINLPRNQSFHRFVSLTEVNQEEK